MNSFDEHAQLALLSAALLHNSDILMDDWRRRANADKGFASSSHLKRRQFLDHIPRVLEALCRKIHSWPAVPPVSEKDDSAATSHAQQRWQQGYDLHSLVREWGHLNSCLVDAIDDFGKVHAEAQEALPVARQLLATHINESVTQSVVEYHRLLQYEAVTRERELQVALSNVRDLEQARGETLRTATHDIKGSLSIVSGSAAMMDDKNLDKGERADMSAMLQRGVTSLSQMLTDLMDMARLESGKEKRAIARLDAAEVMADLCRASQSLADARGLELRVEGAASLPVEGDEIKIRRIAQNLLLNALKYTKQGTVVVAWSACDDNQWLLRIEDTGPGLQTPTASLAQNLDLATKTSRDVDSGIEDLANSAANDALSDSPAPLDAPHGEGIGLSIVKRLCDLLDATLEMRSGETGTTFHVLFPRRYQEA